MRLFVSYARVDKPFCMHIIKMLEVHEVWYDQRLYASQDWWSEILNRLDWCQGFIYLLSPDSVKSEYCQREYQIARSLGRIIFPVLIDEKTELPPDIAAMQYVDMSRGRTPEAVKALLSSILLAERQLQAATEPVAAPSQAPASESLTPPALADVEEMMTEIAKAMDSENYDRAVYLISQAMNNPQRSAFVPWQKMLAEAEKGLEKQTYQRAAEREYRPIAALVQHARTRQFGCEAFRAFRKQFPDYDPLKLASTCDLDASNGKPQPSRGRSPDIARYSLPLLEWCEVPSGLVTLMPPNPSGAAPTAGQARYVEGFFIGRYPVTNAQFQAFIDDPQGYAAPRWWSFSLQAQTWRKQNAQPRPPQFPGDDHPRERVTWFEAVAFALWLSEKTGLKLSLPTELQWQRAAQGDDGRLYPWGSTFDPTRCNTKESGFNKTTPVTRYANGVSPFGLYDMAGNVWEWCLDVENSASETPSLVGDGKRVIRGGSFIGDQSRAQTHFKFYVPPGTFYPSIGFRLVCDLD